MNRLQESLFYLFAILFAALFLLSLVNRGPKYLGKPARYWVKELMNASNPGPAMQALQALGPKECVPLLAPALETKTSPAYLQVWRNSPQILQNLLPNPYLKLKSRWRVAAALGAFGTGAQPATGLLARALKGPDPELQFHAAVALGNLGHAGEPALPALQALLTNNNAVVRQAAADALAKIKRHH